MKRTNITINDADFKFLKSRNFKASRLLRQKINEIRDFEEGEVDFKVANDRLRKRFDKLVGILEESLTEEKFKEITDKM